MADHPHLHRDDLELFAGFLADGLLAATAGAGQLVLGQFVNDVHARQVGRQGLALAAALGRRHDLFRCDGAISRFDHWRRLGGPLFGLVEHGQLRRVGVGTALGFRRKQTVAQQGILFLQFFQLRAHLREQLLQ